MDQDEVDRYILSDTDLQRCLTNPPEFKPGLVSLQRGGGIRERNLLARRQQDRNYLLARSEQGSGCGAVYP